MNILQHTKDTRTTRQGFTCTWDYFSSSLIILFLSPWAKRSNTSIQCRWMAGYFGGLNYVSTSRPVLVCGLRSVPRCGYSRRYTCVPQNQINHPHTSAQEQSHAACVITLPTTCSKILYRYHLVITEIELTVLYHPPRIVNFAAKFGLWGQILISIKESLILRS